MEIFSSFINKSIWYWLKKSFPPPILLHRLLNPVSAKFNQIWYLFNFWELLGMVWLKIWITWSLRLLWTHLGSGYHRAMVQNSLYQPVNVASKTFGLIQAISFDAGSTWYHLLSSPWQTRGPPLSPLHALLPFPPTNKQIRSFQWSMILSKYKKISQIYFCALV